MSTDTSMTQDNIAETVKVTVYPNHVIPWHSVTIAIVPDPEGITPDMPHEVCYHFISPERALSLLAQLQQAQATLEQMVQEKGVR